MGMFLVDYWHEGVVRQNRLELVVQKNVGGFEVTVGYGEVREFVVEVSQTSGDSLDDL